jgi:hypothetical protein
MDYPVYRVPSATEMNLLLAPGVDAARRFRGSVGALVSRRVDLVGYGGRRSASALGLGVRHSAFGVRRSAFGVRRSVFGVRCSALGLGVRRSAFGVRRSAFGVPRRRSASAFGVGVRRPARWPVAVVVTSEGAA